MAGDWIKMRMDLSDDPAVITMASKLGLDEHGVIGRLYSLWAWANRQSRDGHADGVTEKWIDRYVQHDGFASALSGVGWLTVDSNGISFPNFDRHNGKSAKTRALNAVRQRHARVTDSSRKQRDKSVTREEKRRSKPPIAPQPGFERFWAAWPAGERKQAKGKCSEVWRKLGCEADTDKIVAHVESLKPSSDWQRGYDPAPLVYLNQRRWEGAGASRERQQQQLKVAL